MAQLARVQTAILGTDELDSRHCFNWQKGFEMKLGSLIVLALVFIALVPAACMWLWNWLMPDLFGLQTIGYWQALGLMVLSSCFFYRGS